MCKGRSKFVIAQNPENPEPLRGNRLLLDLLLWAPHGACSPHPPLVSQLLLHPSSRGSSAVGSHLLLSSFLPKPFAGMH